MIGWAIGLLVARGWASWQAKLAVFAGLVLVIAIAIGAVVATIFHSGETAGTATVEKKNAAAQGQVIAKARVDERSAQATSAHVAADVGRKTDTTTAIVTATRLEIKHAIDSTPRAAPGGPVPIVDGRGLSKSADELIEGANRSAATADAQP